MPALPASYQPASSTATPLRIGGRAWRVIVGYGHSPEHAALYCEELGVLISGDMLLPRISTNVSVLRHRARRRPARAVTSTRIDRVRAPAGRHAGAALARPPVPRPAGARGGSSHAHHRDALRRAARRLRRAAQRAGS
ncbi:MAG: MBL fold metallo-hydrolase [Comamonadaceae bacterium]|nr:MBL fold metallo-hydrolase [Comamonadaceae bacterium]